MLGRALTQQSLNLRNPSAKLLDTGKDLKVETLSGEAISKRALDIGEVVTSETEVVVIWFDAIKKGQSARIRIEETYTDKNRYVLTGDEFIFDRAFGRPFATSGAVWRMLWKHTSVKISPYFSSEMKVSSSVVDNFDVKNATTKMM